MQLEVTVPRTRVGSPELAAHCLRLLLARPGRYRAYWACLADKTPPGDISQAAVARVIAAYLRGNGQRAPDDDRSYRALKDRVNRALTGQALTPSTLQLFAQAFMLTRDDARQLWAYLLGTTVDQTPDLLDQAQLPPTGAAGFQPPGFRIISLRETHEIDSEGLPSKHKTSQEILATTDSVSRCAVRFDTDALAVAVPDGAVSDLYRCQDGLYAIDILLPRSLQRGEVQRVEYTVHYRASVRDDRCFQRSALRYAIDEASVEIQFSPRRRPRNVWWAIWQDLRVDSPPALREPVVIDPTQHSVRKQVQSAAGTVFGFCWDW